MPEANISILNESNVVTDDEVIEATADLQTQVSRDFAEAWGIEAQLTFVPRNSQPAEGSWWLVILDNSDQAGALGYHDTTNEGLPLGKVFAATDKQEGTNWTVTASHELLEMLADPGINLAALIQSNGSGMLYAYEVADACEADNYGYNIGNTLVSDFVYPAWFESFTPAGARLDKQGYIDKPLQILPGGYISVLDLASSSGWQQTTGEKALASYSSRARVGSRRERRRTPRPAWLKSGKPFALSASRGGVTAVEAGQAAVEFVRPSPNGSDNLAKRPMSVLLVHGVDTNEDSNPYEPWITAITKGLNNANAGRSLNAAGLDYNDLFDKHSSNVLLYGAATIELLASAAWHTITIPRVLGAVPTPAQPGEGFLSEIRWTAGMVAQWVVEDGLRSDCRDRLFNEIQTVKPDVILAHSLGSLICYDFFANDARGKTAFQNGTFITFGSQIGNTFVRDRMWNGQVEMIPVARWINLYNPNDPVFVASLDVLATSFYQFVPVFGSAPFDLSAHEATQGDGHPGYLDNPVTDKYVFPLLAGGSMASLIERNMRVMKRTPKDLQSAVALLRSTQQGAAAVATPGSAAIPTAGTGTDRIVTLLEPQRETGPLPKPPASSAAGIDQVVQIAAESAIFHYSWPNRGVAPAGYIKGMAVVFARVYGRLAAGDPAAVEMAKANTGNGTRDALAWYSERFQSLGMSNEIAGADTLRHLFVLLVGLGMRESSGRYCEGRDRSASNTTADTAEAGLFQTSFNARSASPLMPMLFTQYSANPAGFVEIFQEGVHVKASDLENFGTGAGMEFQRLSKASPAFAAEFAAVGLRNIRTHWGPINTRAAELRNECDAMFRQVQMAVDESNLQIS